MTSAANLQGCFMTAACTDLTTWPEWPFFRQQMPGGRPPRHFTAAVLASVFIHVLLALLFWIILANRTAVAPVDSLFDRSLTVSLVTLPPPAAKPAVPEAPPDQSPRPVPEAETEAAVETESPEILKAETPEEKSPAIEEAPLIDPEEASRPAQEAGRMTLSKIEEALASESTGPGIPVPGSPGADGTPALDLKAAFSIAREVGKTSMSASEAQEIRFTSKKLALKNRLGIVVKQLPDCRTVYSGMGYFAIPMLLKDAITKGGCTWEKSAVLEKPSERETERHKDEERLDTFKRTINETLFNVE